RVGHHHDRGDLRLRDGFSWPGKSARIKPAARGTGHAARGSAVLNRATRHWPTVLQRQGMKAQVISNRRQASQGQNLTTNSQWPSGGLAEAGMAVGWHPTVADALGAKVAAFGIAAGRARLVLASGGLGPTQDDLTREALAKAAGVELVLYPESLAHIQE